MNRKKNNYKEDRFDVIQGDALQVLTELSEEPIFDLVVTSPPYNIGKEYETKKSMEVYLKEQKLIIEQFVEFQKINKKVSLDVINNIKTINKAYGQLFLMRLMLKEGSQEKYGRRRCLIKSINPIHSVAA